MGKINCHLAQTEWHSKGLLHVCISSSTVIFAIILHSREKLGFSECFILKLLKIVDVNYEPIKQQKNGSSYHMQCNLINVKDQMLNYIV